MGVAWNPRKPRLTHTLPVEEGEAGVDSRGCNIRQDPRQSTRGDKPISNPSREAMARHQRQLRAVVHRHRLDTQGRLIEAFTPVSRGWSHDCSTLCRDETFEPRDAQRRQQLRSWIRCRQPPKRLKWGSQKDGRPEEGQWNCRPRAGGKRWGVHTATPMQRHVPGQGRRSPDEGDEVHWSRSRAHQPGGSRRVVRLLKSQDGRWTSGGDAVTAGDVLDVEPRIPRQQGGSDVSTNWQRWHRDCRVEKPARDRRRGA